AAPARAPRSHGCSSTGCCRNTVPCSARRRQGTPTSMRSRPRGWRRDRPFGNGACYPCATMPLHGSILLILIGSQWHKCRQEGLPDPSSTPFGGSTLPQWQVKTGSDQISRDAFVPVIRED